MEYVVVVLVAGRTFSTTKEAEVVEVVAISQVLRAATTTPARDTEKSYFVVRPIRRRRMKEILDTPIKELAKSVLDKYGGE